MSGPPLTEEAFQQRILDYCRLRGLLAYHTHDSRRSVAGFPDLVIVGGDRILYRELKTNGGKLSADQEKWLVRLKAAGGDASVWRPHQWDLIVSILDAIR